MIFDFQVTVPKHCRTATIGVALDGKTLVEHDATPDEVAEMIELLGRVQATLVDAIPLALDPGARVPTAENANFAVQDQEGKKLLLVRHPGYGWLGFLLEEHTRNALAQLLSAPPEN